MNFRRRIRFTSAMRNFASIGLALIWALVLADDLGPVVSPGEYEALHLIGRMIGQEIAARRCDALLESEGRARTPSRLDQHRAVLVKLRPLLERAHRIADEHYQSLVGEGWEVARDAQYARLREVTEVRPIDVELCEQLGVGMDRRLAVP